MSNSVQLVQKLWNYYCNILRDDGLSYGDYVEQLRPPFNEPSVTFYLTPAETWLSLPLSGIPPQALADFCHK